MFGLLQIQFRCVKQKKTLRPGLCPETAGTYKCQYSQIYLIINVVTWLWTVDFWVCKLISLPVTICTSVTFPGQSGTSRSEQNTKFMKSLNKTSVEKKVINISDI